MLTASSHSRLIAETRLLRLPHPRFPGDAGGQLCRLQEETTEHAQEVAVIIIVE